MVKLGPRCPYCAGWLTKPNQRVCVRCRASKGKKSLIEWLSGPDAPDLMEHRIAQDTGANDRRQN